MYAASTPVRKGGRKVPSSKNTDVHCTFCDKAGHTAEKCWNKPPYYCPRCKTQGHNLQKCPDKPQKKSKKGSERREYKSDEPSEKGAEKSLMMLTQTNKKMESPSTTCYRHITPRASKGQNHITGS